MKIQKNNNSGDVVNGDKIGLDEQGVSAMLDDKQRKFLDNARLNLNKAVSEENIESQKVLRYCTEIKKFLPDDFMANFYEVACGGTEKQINKFLGDIDIEKNRKHVKEIADFLLKGMEYSSVLPLKNLVDISLSGDEKTKYLTAIEQEAEKIEEGVYSTQIPRDVFVAYSSKDYKKVNEIVEYLEDNKITCFVALRNLRHGKGAVEHYDEALKEAMHNCDCVVFLSSNNSRSLECDALKQEIPYIRDHEPKMGRIEYLLEDYNENTSIAAKRICEKFFKNIAYCKYIDDLVDRVTDYITGFDSKSTDISEAAGKSPREKVKYCLACGAENPQRSKFCIECGAKDFSDYQGYINENEELKKQKPEEAGKQREVIETQAEEPKLKSPQKPENPVGQIERPESELQPPKPAYPTLENDDKNEFEIQNGVLTRYRGKSGNVKIPNSVTSIGDYAFSDCYNLTSITIPDSVTSIGSYAFYACKNITCITVPNSVSSIGERSFANCASLKSVTIGNSVNSIGESAFWGCKSLANITIPNSVTSISESSFLDCTSLASINIPDSVTSIGYEAFSGCKSLISITIPNSVASIEEGVFNGCRSLASIEIPNSVTFIGFGAFDECINLTIYCEAEKKPKSWDEDWNCDNRPVVWGYGKKSKQVVTEPVSPQKPAYPTLENDDKNEFEIKDGVLKKYKGNKANVIIPEGVTSIGDRAFCGCKNLTSITIPNSVTSIGYYAFYGCESLTNITIPDSVTSIDDCAFGDCDNLTSIAIPDSVTSIGDCAFAGCTSLTNVNIGNGVTSIGMGVFARCNLESITIPNSVTSIGDRAFCGCKNLTSITIPNSVTSIGYFAFYWCFNLTSITIPDSVTSISHDAFEHGTNIIKGAGKHEDKIEVKPWLAADYPTIEHYDKSGIIIESKVLKAYKFKTAEAKIPYGVTVIDRLAFSGGNFNLRKLPFENVVIPDSVKSINEDAFWGCDRLKSIYIPYSVTFIDEEAFAWCHISRSIVVDKGNPNFADQDGMLFNKNKTKLIKAPSGLLNDGEKAITSITIPDSVTSIGSGAFYGCTNFTSITIPENVTSIGSGAFNGCTNLTNITIPNSVTSIGSRAFENCTSLESITIPNSVTSIGSYAFCGCTNLTSITIPDSVTSIGWGAFACCPNITNVNFKNSIGWKVSKKTDMFLSKKIRVTSDMKKNARLLTSKYYNYYWKREQK